jgi:hypothetical protein
MRDDYLWDGSGEPDPEIQKLETTLSRLRHHRAAPAFPEDTILRPRLWQLPWFRSAAAAAVILVIGMVTLINHRSRPAPESRGGWEVTRVAGTPKVGGQKLGAHNETGKLILGQMLETDSSSQANIRVEEVGEIVVDPDTRLRVPATDSGIKRLSLDRGTIHASIWAPAGEFAIDTPSAVAVDLGCAYTLYVDDSGNAILHTTVGWVGFKLSDRESFIPAGAACHTRRASGPGIPYFEDAPAAFLSALSQFDLSGSTPAEKASALQIVLVHARKRDALTLWHLLSRVPDQDRGPVYDRLASLVPAPPGVTRDGILHLDQNMLDLWWNQLGFGDVSLWRHWERTWSEQNNKQ